MPYAFVNDTQNSVDGALGTNISAPAVNINSSNLLVVASTYSNAAAQSTTITDNIGTNTYVPLQTVYNASFNVGLAFFYALNSAGGSTTFTATVSASSTSRGIYVGQYSGLTNLITSTGQQNENPGTFPNAYNSGNAPVGVVPAMAWGFIAPVHNFTVAPTAGTSPLVFTGRTPSWQLGGGGAFFALAEDARIITAGNVAATFTATDSGAGRFVLLAVFQETILQQVGSTGIFVSP